MPHSVVRGVYGGGRNSFCLEQSGEPSDRRPPCCWAGKMRGGLSGSDAMGSTMSVEGNTGGLWRSRNKVRKAGKQENTWCFGKSLNGSV